MALINNNTKHSKNLGYERGQTEPDLVAFYVIRSGNGAGLYSYNPGAHTGQLNTDNNNLLTIVYTETDNAWLLRKQKLSY